MKAGFLFFSSLPESHQNIFEKMKKNNTVFCKTPIYKFSIIFGTMYYISNNCRYVVIRGEK